MKTITLTLEQARSMYKKDATMDELILANFSKEELEKKELPKNWEELEVIDGYFINSSGKASNILSAWPPSLMIIRALGSFALSNKR